MKLSPMIFLFFLAFLATSVASEGLRGDLAAAAQGVRQLTHTSAEARSLLVEYSGILAELAAALREAQEGSVDHTSHKLKAILEKGDVIAEQLITNFESRAADASAAENSQLAEDLTFMAEEIKTFESISNSVESALTLGNEDNVAALAAIEAEALSAIADLAAAMRNHIAEVKLRRRLLQEGTVGNSNRFLEVTAESLFDQASEIEFDVLVVALKALGFTIETGATSVKYEWFTNLEADALEEVAAAFATITSQR